MKILIKVGTQSILAADGKPDEAVITSLVQQIVELKQNQHQVVLVSSGAVGFGRSVARQMLGREYGNSIAEKQVLASLGQHELMHVYSRLFGHHGLLASQLLLTKQDFHTRKHYLNIARVLTELLKQNNIIPIVNENDTIAIEQLMFTDNDELAGLIAAQIDADKLIMLSNVTGVFDGHPEDISSRLISIIDPKNGWPKISTIKSKQGRGGMQSKIATARKMSSLGITTHIAHISAQNVIIQILNGAELGTKVLPTKKASTIKKWIACHTGQTIGSIKINPGLTEILIADKKITSILPIGIVECSGEFKRGDVVSILSPDNQPIGLGLAKYDANKLNSFCGQKNKPVFIHYDHLHIFSEMRS